MEKEEQKKKHQCRICLKFFPCGRSLGGHMRAHKYSCSSDAELEKEKIDGSRGKAGDFGASYGLRENPKKTWRISDFANDDPSSSPSRREKQCKECGKEFPSWKALFGHMRCHSDKISRRSSETGDKKQNQENVEDEASWNEKKVLSSDRDVMKRKSKRPSPAIAADSSSSITEYEPEQEDVAISLMMLSRGIGGYWPSRAAVAGESSDNHCVVFEEDKHKRSESVDFDCCVAGEDSADESRKKKNLNSAQFGTKKARIDENGNVFKEKLGREYQCAACNKTFSSYQSLGGHRASHKRIRGCCLLKDEYSIFEKEASRNHLTEMEETRSSLLKKNRIHECIICGKVFSSGQALGGHKRSHVVSNGETKSIEQQAPDVAEVPELLDLNLPAPVVEESSNVKPWWAVESLIFEQPLVSLISN